MEVMTRVRGWRDKLTEDDYRRLYARGMRRVTDRSDRESARAAAERAVCATAARWIRERKPKPLTSVDQIEHLLEAKGMPHGGPTTVIAEHVANTNAKVALDHAIKERRAESSDKYPPIKLVTSRTVFDKELASLTRLGASHEDAQRWLNEATDRLRKYGEASSDPDSDDDDMPDMSRRR